MRLTRSCSTCSHLNNNTLPLTCPHPRASSPAPSAPNSGPSDTLYEHGCFRCILNFPRDYPHSPPSMHFSPPIWHPNVHEDGKVSFQHFPIAHMTKFFA